MSEKRFTVALYLGDLENEFSSEIFYGAAHTAEQLNINLIVFPVRFIESDNAQHELQNKRFQYQYNCMFSYAENQSFDAVIIETAVMSKYVTKDAISAILKRYKNTPVITISEKIDDYPSVSFSSNGIELEISHLVKNHGCKKIGFVSGPSSNLEAVARFEEYKKALEKNGIEYDPELVAEGDFTEECREVIAALLDKKGKELDALCFANDHMAVAGYSEIKRRNLKIGKDILVTGFDDIPSAAALPPPLTTIRANYRELGTSAVSAAYSVLSEVKIPDITVSTTLVKRDSCGCKSKLTENTESLNFLISNDDDITAFMNKINDILYDYCNNTHYQMSKRGINGFLRFIRLILSQAKNDEIMPDKNLIIFKFNMLINDTLSFISVDNLNFLLTSVCDKAVSLTDRCEKRAALFNLFMEFYKILILHNDKQSNSRYHEIRDNMYTANSIIGKVIDDPDSGRRVHHDIINELTAISVNSSFLYLHESPAFTHSRYDWAQPDSEILYSYHNNKTFRQPSKPIKIKSSFLFKNDYLPAERFTFIAAPIFCREENYGLLLCSMDIEDYIYYSSIVIAQVAYALKLKNMLEEQKNVQLQLRKSLNEVETDNKKLSAISKMDELTGIFNRRGFFENVYDSLRHNVGKTAVIIYADLDNLKKINDIFGHDEGDYAIRKAALILKQCLRTGDISARFGGDEFAGFAVICENDFETIFRDRLDKLCDELNKISGKPYNIHLSAGTFKFTCEKNADITKLMNEADKVLYEYKKNKSKNVLKNPSDILNYSKKDSF